MLFVGLFRTSTTTCNYLLLVSHEVLCVLVGENAWSFAGMLGFGVLANLPEPWVTINKSYLLVCVDLVEENVSSGFFESLDVFDLGEMNVGDVERVAGALIFTLNHIHMIDTHLAENLIENGRDVFRAHLEMNTRNADGWDFDDRRHDS